MSTATPTAPRPLATTPNSVLPLHHEDSGRADKAGQHEKKRSEARHQARREQAITDDANQALVNGANKKGAEQSRSLVKKNLETRETSKQEAPKPKDTFVKTDRKSVAQQEVASHKKVPDSSLTKPKALAEVKGKPEVKAGPETQTSKDAHQEGQQKQGGGQFSLNSDLAQQFAKLQSGTSNKASQAKRPADGNTGAETLPSASPEMPEAPQAFLENPSNSQDRPELGETVLPEGAEGKGLELRSPLLAKGQASSKPAFKSSTSLDLKVEPEVFTRMGEETARQLQESGLALLSSGDIHCAAEQYAKYCELGVKLMVMTTPPSQNPAAAQAASSQVASQSFVASREARPNSSTKTKSEKPGEEERGGPETASLGVAYRTGRWRESGNMRS